MVTQPSILNGPTVYETGAGGGAEYVEILGNYYKVIEINGVKWLDANLKFTKSSWASSGQSASNPIVNQLANRNYWYQTKACPFVGFYYNLPAFKEFLNEELPDGWKVPSVDDWKNLLDDINISDIRTSEWWTIPGNNSLSFNLFASGYQDGNSLNGGDSGSYLWASDNDGTNYNSITVYRDDTYTINTRVLNSYNKSLNIRLCK